jgi:hypothetical protein
MGHRPGGLPLTSPPPVLYPVFTQGFKARIADHPERVENLYFALLFTLRGVIKAAPQLKRFDFDAGDEEHNLALYSWLTS